MAYLNDSDLNNSLDSLLLNNSINYSAGEDKVNASFVNFAPLLLKKGKLATKKLLDLYKTLEKPLISVLIKMEKEGFSVDEKTLNDLGEDYKATLELLSEKNL